VTNYVDDNVEFGDKRSYAQRNAKVSINSFSTANAREIKLLFQH